MRFREKLDSQLLFFYAFFIAKESYLYETRDGLLRSHRVVGSGVELCATPAKYGRSHKAQTCGRRYRFSVPFGNRGHDELVRHVVRPAARPPARGDWQSDVHRGASTGGRWRGRVCLDEVKKGLPVGCKAV